MEILFWRRVAGMGVGVVSGFEGSSITTLDDGLAPRAARPMTD
jgi:hypothetical protein